MFLYQVRVVPKDLTASTFFVQARSDKEAKAVAVDVYREQRGHYKGLRIRLEINVLCTPEKNKPGWVYPVAGGGTCFYTFRS